MGGGEVFDCLSHQALPTNDDVAFRYSSVSSNGRLLGQMSITRPPPTFTEYVGYFFEFAENIQEIMDRHP
jgi:hypothetical protein